MCIRYKHGRGGVISFLVPGQQRAARFRASTLGDGYGPEDVQAVIDGKAPTRTATARKAPAQMCIRDSIMADRKKLKSANGLYLGSTGSGKSFAAKRELLNVFLAVPQDRIIVVDPMGEYAPQMCIRDR